jgi:hypothetical protein
MNTVFLESREDLDSAKDSLAIADSDDCQKLKIISLVVKNSPLLKSYLLVNMIQSNEKAKHDIYETVLVDKLLLKIVELLLENSEDGNEAEENETLTCDYEPLYNYIFIYFYILTEAEHSGSLSVAYGKDQSEFKAIIERLNNSTKIEIENLQKSQQPSTGFFGSLVKKLGGFFNKQTVSTSIDYSTYQQIFDSEVLAQLNQIVFKIIEKLVAVSQSKLLEQDELTLPDSDKLKSEIFELSRLVSLSKNNSKATRSPQLSKRKLQSSKSDGSLTVQFKESSSSIDVRSKRARGLVNRVSVLTLLSDEDPGDKIDKSENEFESTENATENNVPSLVVLSDDSSLSGQELESGDEDDNEEEYSENNDEEDSEKNYESEENANSLSKIKSMKSTGSGGDGEGLWGKFSPLSISVLKLPGIGVTYAQRLRDKKVNKLGDLVRLYEVNCQSNVETFRTELKENFNMRMDSANKLVNLVRSYLDNQD